MFSPGLYATDFDSNVGHYQAVGPTYYVLAVQTPGIRYDSQHNILCFSFSAESEQIACFFSGRCGTQRTQTCLHCSASTTGACNGRQLLTAATLCLEPQLSGSSDESADSLSVRCSAFGGAARDMQAYHGVWRDIVLLCERFWGRTRAFLASFRALTSETNLLDSPAKVHSHAAARVAESP